MNENYTICELCPKDVYNVNKINAASCKDCPKDRSDCENYTIWVHPGYWRATVFSDADSIYECRDTYGNCLGGTGVGDSLCATGFVGAACEGCDIYGKRDGNRYTSGGIFI